MKAQLNIDDVMWTAEKTRGLRLSTLSEGRIFHVRPSEAHPPGVRFDRYATHTYDTIKRVDVEKGISVFNRLPTQDRQKPSLYAGNHRAASYLAAFLNHCAATPSEAPSNDESDLPEFSGQGFGLTPLQRKAVEDWGVECATRYYRERGWNVVTRGKPFDLLCTKPSSATLYVEVKASTGKLDEILVTAGEIDFACANPSQVDLFLLEMVELKRNRASGGEFSRDLWHCDRKRARPTHFRYRIREK